MRSAVPFHTIRKADARLKDVCGDILKAGTILTKSLLALDQVAQESAHPVVEREVNNIKRCLGTTWPRQP